MYVSCLLQLISFIAIHSAVYLQLLLAVIKSMP